MGFFGIVSAFLISFTMLLMSSIVFPQIEERQSDGDQPSREGFFALELEICFSKISCNQAAIKFYSFDKEWTSNACFN